jgi:hypothetical protein
MRGSGLFSPDPAFVGPSHDLQVGPHGVSGKENLTVFSGNCRIDAIGPDCTLIPGSHADRRYSEVPSQQFADLGASFHLSNVFYRDGGLVDIVEGNVLTLA